MEVLTVVNHVEIQLVILSRGGGGVLIVSLQCKKVGGN